jgi:glycosyltransferase involved in cell wall biosynthesis
MALVTYALEIGGVESVLLSLAEYFKSHNHHVDFIETSSKGLWSDEFVKKGYDVHSIIINPFESRIHHANRLAKHLKDYDAILINDAPYAQSIIGLLPASVIVLPILHNNLDSMINNAISNKGQWDRIVCVSPSLQNALREKTSVLEAETVVISNGVSVVSHWPKSKENFDTIELLKILFVGRVEQTQKGVLYLPTIIKSVLEKSIQPVHLTIIGDGPSMDDLKKEIAELHLNDYISILGSLDHENVISQMQQHNVLLMPSHFEGHPIVLMEAMAQGLVPIVSLLPGHTDHVVSNKENGYLCNIDNLQCFSDAIVKLQKEKNLLKEMSKKAWEKVFNDFSRDAMASSYIDLINSLQKNHKIRRTNEIETILLGDLPYSPHILVRPIRKILRLLGVWNKQ